MYEFKVNNIYVMSLISVVFVSLIFNLFIRNEVDFSYLAIDVGDMDKLLIQSKKDVIQYILFKRIKQIIVIVILIKAFGVARVFNLTIVACGGLIGLMVSSQVYYVGIIGIVILLLYLLPHFILYYLALKYGYTEKLFESTNDENLKKFAGVMFIFVCGIVIECIFMTNFLKFFYQYMVT